METTNKIKRESRFKKTFSYYLRHPQYDELKKFYINGSFNNIKSVKNQFEKNGNGKWIRCSNESTCLKMAEKGYIVKKAVERGHESQS
jgi:hypothetical protein